MILETMAASASSIPSRKDMQNEVDQAKPIPKPNLQAETPAEVYPLERLVGLPALGSLPVRDWIDKVEAGEEIKTKSRFVSSRIVQVVRRGDVKMLKALKYLLLLLEWYICLKATSRGGKKILGKEDIAKAITWAGNDLLEGVKKRFGDETYVKNPLLLHFQLSSCSPFYPPSINPI
jgi:DNA-directed RNA polymerase I subunit RPA49